MKLKKIISAAVISAAVTVSSLTVYAKEITVGTDIYQPDEICGYIKINSTPDADVYLKVYKHTPETAESGYLVYDTIIESDTVHATNTYVYDLEYNEFNIESGTYEGSYDIMVGVNKHVDSEDKNDVAYNTINLVVEDINYSGTQTNCTINITVTEENMEQPLCIESGDKYNKAYDMKFAQISFLAGDANADGKINVRDCAFIASKLAQGKSEELTVSADFNADGKVNVRDAAGLASSLAGQTTVPVDPTEPTVPTDTTETATATTETNVTEVTETIVTESSSEETIISSETVVQDPIEPEVSSTVVSETVVETSTAAYITGIVQKK